MGPTPSHSMWRLTLSVLLGPNTMVATQSRVRIHVSPLPLVRGLDTATTVTDSMVRHIEQSESRSLTSVLQLMWDYVVRGHQTTAALATMPS